MKKIFTILYLSLISYGSYSAVEKNQILNSGDSSITKNYLYFNFISGDIGYEYFLNSRNSLLIEGSLNYVLAIDGTVHPRNRYAMGYVPSILLEYRHYFFQKRRFFVNGISSFGDNKRSFTNPKFEESDPNYPKTPLIVLGVGYQKGFWNRGYFRISAGTGLLYKGFNRNIGMGYNLSIDLGIRF